MMSDTRNEDKLMNLLTIAHDDLLVMWKRHYSSIIFNYYQLTYNKIMYKTMRILYSNDYVIL